MLADLYRAATAEVLPQRGGNVLVGLHARREPLVASFEGQFLEPGQLVVVGHLGPRASGAEEGGAEGVMAAPSKHEPPDVVGYGCCHAVSMADGEQIGVIDELYVMAAYRRQGAGRAMSNMMVDWCRGRGCTGVDAWALPGSRAVKSFFESGRFTARALVMHQKL